MRVLHFFKTYYPDTFGGVERTIHALAKGGLEKGVRSTVLSLSRNPIQNTVTFDGHSAQKSKLSFEFASTGFSADAFSMFSEASQKADIIHYHFPWPFMDLVHLWQRPEKPCLVTYHSDIVKQKILLRAYQPLMYRFLGSLDRIVATSNNYVATSPVLQSHRAKVHVIPIGLDEADYPKAPDHLKQEWRRRFHRPFFLFVGVLRYYKGVQFLLEAAKDLPADIVIMGAGPMSADLKQRAVELNLNNVHFLADRSDLDKAALLALCTAFVFPSHLRSEAYGLSLVEAAMFGKPMISCEIGTGTSFVNQDRQTGLVVPPGNPEALASAMRTLLLEEALRRTLGEAARQRYEHELRAETMVDRYVMLYHQLERRAPIM